MEFIDIWCSAAIVLGLCILPIIIILGIIVYRDNKKERNHDKQRDDFNLRKYEYSGGTVKDFNDRCRKSFFDSIGLHEEEDEKDDEYI